ncbi:putative RNA uridine N3 methyltransferase [Methanonatronarchaeum sp. AMET6-2]|uniref:putative RNA uridine N3 methyltransferase n=1 Tax=Methanonatronarchaeum sp. AMET6-2 TaxID=2933293 RepID=UPI00122BA14F|nr:putative RNA uridine N3 methyltransferase [Methanonatronarchaeum sp. AMET6-2]RZN61005.1 MAG: hypothetical protein EF811_05855 [Methanonatronarchaeia archaeon]UOY10700.1 hypothetical protein MU439_03420 [Methanonatronarchaeum sp. AMET6-2]
MKKTAQEVRVLIPSSLTVESRDKKVKTVKIGYVARAAAIFKVDSIRIYRDETHDESNLIKKVLDYSETPPYLKKKVFGLDDDLRYVGTIPPLQIPSHNLDKTTEVGEIREGFVLEKFGDERVGSDYCARVYIGLDRPALLADCEGLSEKQRITVRTISCDDKIVVEKVPPNDVPWYWGFDVGICDLDTELKNLKQGDWSVISTSRKGEVVSNSSIDQYLSDRTAVIFGSPDRGVSQITGRMDLVDQEINTIPNQGTKTVRTEEAIHSTLTILNLNRK